VSVSDPVHTRPGGLGLPGAVLTGIATLIRLVCGSFAIVLAAYVVCAVGQANPNNWLVLLVGQWASGLNLGLDGLSQVENIDYRTIVDFGAAALGWMLIGYLASWVCRLLGGR
jgi:hypothetical protein